MASAVFSEPRRMRYAIFLSARFAQQRTVHCQQLINEQPTAPTVWDVRLRTFFQRSAIEAAMATSFSPINQGIEPRSGRPRGLSRGGMRGVKLANSQMPCSLCSGCCAPPACCVQEPEWRNTRLDAKGKMHYWASWAKTLSQRDNHSRNAPRMNEDC